MVCERPSVRPVARAVTSVNMSRIYSFPPVVQKNATRLILGSVPGKASLAANQYYAHPRNIFWPVVEAVIGVDFSLPYETRCNELTRNKIALWDVLKACTRTSSLDSDIVESSIVPNNFEKFFQENSKIRTIYFNGAKAESIYTRYVIPNLSPGFAAMGMVRLPSTSPANASIPVAERISQWKVVLTEESQ